MIRVIVATLAHALLLCVGIVIAPLLAVAFAVMRYVHTVKRITSKPRSLAGETIIITGAAGGFGSEYCAMAIIGGAKRVFALDVTPPNATTQRISERLERESQRDLLSHIVPVQIDITDEAAIRRFVNDHLEPLDDAVYCLVNNAGIGGGPCAAAESCDTAQIRKVFDVNFFGAVALTRAVFPYMQSALCKKGKTARRGRIVNIASCAGLVSGAGFSAYSSSKFALESYSDSLRIELEEYGVDVAIIEPYFAATPILLNALGEDEKKRIETSPWRHRYERMQAKLDVVRQDASGLMTAKFVAQAMYRASTEATPQDRYLVAHKKPADWVMRLMAHAPNYFSWVDKLKDKFAEKRGL